MMDREQNNGLLALLAWWREAGVSDALDDVPVDWASLPGDAPGAGFQWPDRETEAASAEPAAPPRQERVGARTADTQPQRRAETQASAPKIAPVTSTAGLPLARREAAAVASAREAARSARTLDELEKHLSTFDGCALKATAKSTCFYRGNPTARLMVIGEAPGRDEDLAGKPFVGRAGQLLDRMLAAIDLTEADVHITNIVYWRPPGNRTPTPEEAQACRPFLERQIEIVSPDVILTLGGPAAKAMLDTPEGILRLRGRWREITIGDRTFRLMPSLHPAYLLRQPEAKRQAWRDLLQLKLALDGEPEGKVP
jgi:DNA polymerase